MASIMENRRKMTWTWDHKTLSRCKVAQEPPSDLATQDVNLVAACKCLEESETDP